MNNNLTEYEINYYFIDLVEMKNSLIKENAKQEYKQVLQKRYIYTIPIDIKSQISLLKKELFGFIQPEKEEDIFRLLPYGDYLRIRDEGNGIVTLSVKVHAKKDGNMNDQKEAESIIYDVESIQRILEKYGFIIKNIQENMREKWRLSQECTLTIDWWPFLQPYVEIEGVSEQTVFYWADKLGLTVLEKKGLLKSTFSSVSEIYSETFGINPNIMLSEKILTFDKKPDWIL